ncbi:MAG TPA: LuxR C-terminal-related transcriptional regulator, partial [Kofleriaceae bacterium]|nr:LuxR C-terminal-related transcriptional regulator [Kofleriaceae bacterium]
MAWAALGLHDEVGVSIADLLEGLPFDEAGLRRRRVAWNDYCTIVERLAEAAGSMTELEDVLCATYHKALPELRMLAGALVAPKAMYRFTFEVIDPIFIPPVDFRYEDRGDTIHLEAWLRPGARPCAAWFHGSTGAIRGMPAHLDLAPAEIVAADVGPDHGVWDVRLPASRTVLDRARTTARRLTLRFVLGTDPDGTPVTATIGEPESDPIVVRLDLARAAWQLTPRQAEVLALVAEGHANKDIAQQLDCAENTVELHITRLFRKAKVTSR